MSLPRGSHPLLANGREVELSDLTTYTSAARSFVDGGSRILAGESFAITRIHEILDLDDPVRLENGLSDAQVIHNRMKHGENKLPEDKPTPWIVYFLLEFSQPVILILLVFLGLTIYNFATQDPDLDVILRFSIITFVVLTVTISNANGNATSSNALGELSALAASNMARVRRNGREYDVPALELVVGDVVLVKSGDTVQADIRVMETIDLACIEAALTGEPHECKKTIRSVDPTAPFLSSMMYSGTSVVCGSGFGVVTAVGISTEIGQIAQKLDRVESLESPIQKTMKQLGGILIVLVLASLFTFIAITWFTDDYDRVRYDEKWVGVLFESLALAQIFLPTTLSLTVTILLKNGVDLLKSYNAVLKRFTAVETLGCTTVICSDKTGTLTEGQMTAVRCCTITATAANHPEASNFRFYPTRGFDPSGGLFPQDALSDGRKSFIRGSISGSIESIQNAGRRLSAQIARPNLNLGDKSVAEGMNPLPRAMVGAAFVNCSLDTRLELKEDGSWTCVGNMSEAALVVAAAKVGMWQVGTPNLGQPTEDVLAVYPSMKNLEVPFTSGRKMKMTVHPAPEGKFIGLKLPDGCTHVGVLKGAPDRVQPCCQHVLRAGLADTAPKDEAMKQQLAASNLALANEGLRVLAVSIMPMDAAKMAAIAEVTDADARLQWFKEKGPTLLGLMGLEDPPRDGVKEAVTACHNAGVKVVMITGDQLPTAVSISRKIGIIRQGEDASMISHECGVLHTDPHDPAASKHRSDDEIDALTKHTVVWARAQPVDKIAIVESLQRQGQIAAMTGDGVNDAAALKAADIGTSMGIAGTEVAKASADMILMDDNFSTIVAAVREGRHIYGNLQKYVFFYLGVKLCELVMCMTCVIGGLPRPVAALRALIANNITDLTPMTLAAEVAEPYQMKVAPRPRTEFVLTKQVVAYRLAPQLVWFTTILLVCGSFLSRGFLGTRFPRRATNNLAHWKDETRGNCLQTWICRKQDDGRIPCFELVDFFACRARSTPHKLGSAWEWEFASIRDTVTSKDFSDVSGRLSDSARPAHDQENALRRWRTVLDWDWSRRAEYGVWYYKNTDTGLDRSYQAEVAVLRPCTVRSDGGFARGNGADATDWEHVWSHAATRVNETSTRLCWTPEGMELFFGGADAEARERGWVRDGGFVTSGTRPDAKRERNSLFRQWFPFIVNDVNRADWAFRKLQGTQFLSFVLLELMIQVSCRTEDLFFKAPYNGWFVKVAGVAVGTSILLVYIPSVNKACEMAPVGWWGWLFILFGCAIGLVLAEISKYLFKADLTHRQEVGKRSNPYMNAPIKGMP